MRPPFAIFLLAALHARGAEPLPIDPLWKSETFRRSITASYGIDSRIEPRITEDEAFYLDESAKAMAAGDRAKAIAVLRDSSLLENSPAMLFTLASLEFEAEQASESVKHFEAALAHFPNFRDAHRNYAVVLIQADKLELAKTHLVRALELGAHDGATAGLLAYCHARDGHHQAALDAYRLALLTQPGERQWLLGQAQALLALKQPRPAADLLQTLLEKTPGDVPLWLLQADTRLALDEDLPAAASLEIVHRSGGLQPDAIASLGHLYLQNGLPDLALARYDAALRKEPFLSPSRALEIVELLLSQSDWTRARTVAGWIEASAFYLEAFAPGLADKALLSRLVRARALIELEAGDRAVGAKRVEDWLRQEPLDGAALLLLARFREESNQRVEAGMLLEQAARLPDTAAAAHLAHGRLLVAAGDYETALDHLERSHELNPDAGLARYLEAVRELVDGAK